MAGVRVLLDGLTADGTVYMAGQEVDPPGPNLLALAKSGGLLNMLAGDAKVCEFVQGAATVVSADELEEMTHAKLDDLIAQHGIDPAPPKTPRVDKIEALKGVLGLNGEPPATETPPADSSATPAAAESPAGTGPNPGEPEPPATETPPASPGPTKE